MTEPSLFWVCPMCTLQLISAKQNNGLLLAWAAFFCCIVSKASFYLWKNKSWIGHLLYGTKKNRFKLHPTPVFTYDNLLFCAREKGESCPFNGSFENVWISSHYKESNIKGCVYFKLTHREKEHVICSFYYSCFFFRNHHGFLSYICFLVSIYIYLTAHLFIEKPLMRRKKSLWIDTYIIIMLVFSPTSLW